MAEYIEREALINVCKEIIQDKWNEKACPVSWSHAYADFIDDIENQPTADVEPVRYGVWEREIGDTHSNGIIYYCTSCSKNIIMFNSKLMPTMKYSNTYVFELPKYCPNCGAKMDKTS